MATRQFSRDIPAAELRRLYCDDGLSADRVARLLAVSATAVRTRLVALGIARREPWAHNAVAVGTEELRRLYVDEDLSLSEVALRIGCSLTTVRRRLTTAGVQLRADGGSPKYARKDFSGDPIEMSYLIGFRLGDLHVELEGDTVVVKCTSTRTEQVELFRKLFEPYGRVYTDEATLERRRRKSIGMYARLNRTFDFLLPKQDAIPAWILRSQETFLAFFAGYVDAEGSIQVYGASRRFARLEIRCYDRTILEQSRATLNTLGVTCPAPRCDVTAGYTNAYGVISRGDLWTLGVYAEESLWLLLPIIRRLSKHAKRQRDCETALRVLTHLARLHQ